MATSLLRRRFSSSSTSIFVWESASSCEERVTKQGLKDLCCDDRSGAGSCLRGWPPCRRASIDADLSGSYPSVEMALSTFCLVSPDTLTLPFVTRETVAIDTPASVAMSLTVALTFILKQVDLQVFNDSFHLKGSCEYQHVSQSEIFAAFAIGLDGRLGE